MSALLGASLPRRDGPAKVTGEARYAADHFAEEMLYGVVVGAPVPAGRLRAVDAAAAREIPGITHVLTHAEMPKLGAPPVPPASSIRVPLQDDEIRYEGEPVAIVLGADARSRRVRRVAGEGRRRAGAVQAPPAR